LPLDELPPETGGIEIGGVVLEPLVLDATIFIPVEIVVDVPLAFSELSLLVALELVAGFVRSMIGAGIFT
jgi:hypothetical protein